MLIPVGQRLEVILTFDQYDSDGTAPHYSNLKMKLKRPSGTTLQQNINLSALKKIIRTDMSAGTDYLEVYGDAVTTNLLAGTIERLF